MRVSFAPAVLAAIASMGCADGPQRRELPRVLTPVCKVESPTMSPLATEWDASEKARLETKLREGAVVVSYTGCDLKVLSGCRASGAYGFTRASTSTDTLDIRDEKELYAKLPLGAVALEASLKSAKQLSVETTVSGLLQLGQFDAASLPNDASCMGATHVVQSLSVGAFKLRLGEGSGSGVGVGVGVRTGGQGTVARLAGDPAACSQATERAPHPQCASPVQLFLAPLPREVSERTPRGTVKLTFTSADADRSWSVLAGDKKLCETPCTRWSPTTTTFFLRTGGGMTGTPQEVEVPDLAAHDGRVVEVRARPRAVGEYVTGVTLTSLAGMGLAAGISLMAVGYSSDKRKSLGTAGLYTAIPSAFVLAGGIYLIVDGGAKVTVRPGAVP